MSLPIGPIARAVGGPAARRRPLTRGPPASPPGVDWLP